MGLGADNFGSGLSGIDSGSHHKEKSRNNTAALSEKGHAAKLQIRLSQAAGIKSWHGQGLIRRQMVAAARGRSEGKKNSANNGLRPVMLQLEDKR